MEQPVTFRQRNGLAKVDLRLWPQHGEYSMWDGSRRRGFNFRYESLPTEFNYRRYRPPNIFVLISIGVMAAMLPFELWSSRPNQTFWVFVILGILTLVFAAVAYAASRLMQKPYTELRSQAGALLIARDRAHDDILAELQRHRVQALKRSAVINPAVAPWAEVKRFKWLREEGIISHADFMGYRALILASLNQPTEQAGERVALH